MKEKRRSMKPIDYFIMDCISFTIVSFLLSILSAMEIVQNLNYEILLQLLLCTSVISLVMYIANRILIDSWWKELIIGLVDGTALVLIIGGSVFRWFPWEARYITLVIILFIISYLIAYGVRLIENSIISNQINQKIKDRRK